MKNKKLIIIIAVLFVLGLYFTFIRGIYASSDKIVGPYRDAESYAEFLDYDSWQIGENQYGDPIFCFQDNAFQLIKIKCDDIINKTYDLYHDEYNVGRFSKDNCSDYKDLVNKLPSSKENDSFIRLIELYENGQKRWYYVIGSGWIRK
ncbi:MAG: hypothetical protein Q4E33_04430 [Erysipelotrichaceae bacterium]|nr:hypothetical protein [Erysipelotrichaceae bacterium]